MKTIMIIGATGQDGSILAEKSLKLGYQVVCPIRSEISSYLSFSYINKLILNGAIFVNVDILQQNIFKKLLLTYKPDVVCNFAAVSNVFSPWESPYEVVKINSLFPIMMLDTIIKTLPATKFIQSSSSMVFSGGFEKSCNELTPRSPILPYGIAKNTVDLLISESRNQRSANACSAIFFNHESERRRDRFLTKKVMLAAKYFSKGNKKEKLKLGNLDVRKDMGMARDFMDGVMLMIKEPQPNDYVMGTGKLTSIRTFVQSAFSCYNLDYKEFVQEDKLLSRKTLAKEVVADVTKAKKLLGWSSRICTPKLLLDEEVNN